MSKNQNKWPYFAVALESKKLLAALDRQNFKDFRVVCIDDEVSSRQDLAVFHPFPSTYCLVSLCDDAMQKVLEHEKSLLRLMVELRLRQIDLLVFTIGSKDHEACVGFVLSTASILHAPNIPKSTTGLVVDLIEYIKSLGGRILTKPVECGYVGGFALQKQGRVFGYRQGPIVSRTETRKAIKTDPVTPLALQQCGTNELYGHAQILRDYCGVKENLPIRGRLSHGWQCGSGLIYDDLTALAPSYVWNKRQYACAKDLSEVYAIGSPYIYMPNVPDPGPVNNALLAIPIHSLISDKIPYSDWDEYAKSVVEFAELKGVASVTAMLYCLDFTDDIIAVFNKHGIDCVSSAEQGDANFLCKFRSIVRQYATVICNRISTALFYSLFELRPTYIWGSVMKNNAKDAYEKVADDVDWVKHYFPTILAGGLGGVETAKLELGTDCKKSPEDLRNLLYGWLA
jgi:hypothetical protein